MNDGEWFQPVRERLVLRRRQLGLSQRAAAELGGFNSTHLCHLERGVNQDRPRIPGPRMLARWAKVLRVDTSLVLRLDAAEWDEPFVVDLTDNYEF